MKTWKKLATLCLCAAMAMGVAVCGGGCTVGNGDNTPGGEQTEGNAKVVLDCENFTIFLEEAELSRITASGYTNGKKVDNAKFTYTVKDPAVAEVTAKGNIIPKKAGRTKVTVSYNGATAEADVTIIGTATAEQVNSFDEAYINTYGRTYVKDKKLCLDHVSTGVDVSFDGSSLKAQIEVTGTLYLRVYVDGVEGERIKLNTNKEYTLASGLTNGFHTVRLVKSSEVGDGQIRIKSFSANGFYTAPEKSELKIEFIGDSITAGYGVLGKTGDGRSVENSDGSSSYAYLTAQALGADYSVVAMQGICVKAYHNYNESTGINMDNVYRQVSTRNSAAYNFASDTDVVVLNLGTNDASYISKNYDYSETFADDYKTFLQYVREKNPNAYILCIYGMMGKSDPVDTGINEAIAAVNDGKIVRVDNFVSNNLGANGHPSQTAQKGWGDTLTEYIKDLLNIK